MTRLRQDAIELLEQMPEDKLIFMIQIMKGVRGLYKDENQEAKDLAFESLEKLRKKKRRKIGCELRFKFLCMNNVWCI